MVIALESLTHLNAQELREMVMGLRARVAEHGQQITRRDETIARKDREILYRQAKIDQLTHEMAVFKAMEVRSQPRATRFSPGQLAR